VKVAELLPLAIVTVLGTVASEVSLLSVMLPEDSRYVRPELVILIATPCRLVISTTSPRGKHFITKCGHTLVGNETESKR